MTRDDRRVVGVLEAINRAGRRMVSDYYGRKWPCVYCGGKQQSRDHVIAISLGGRNVIENLVPCCHHCNEMKRDLPAEEFFAAHPRLAFRFAIHALHADATIREMAREHGKRYGATKAFFNGIDDEAGVSAERS